MTSITFDEQHQVLIINPNIMPDDHDFEMWASIFLHHEQINIQEFEQGADRHLQRFRFKEEHFNLNFEHYSSSIWISGEGAFAEELLAELSLILI